MQFQSFTKTIVCVAVVSSLYACGGGGSGGSSIIPVSENNSSSNAPAAQAPSSPDTEVSVATLSGRVADGYIRGATVCIDLNENGSCDVDEPSATTGEGGQYELAMVDGAEGKPILADIPATAIDEDDNMPIGKRMLLSAPPSQREFISPITTLVHQELESNPSVDIEEAEAAVKKELGFSLEDEDASLFTDYVAHGDDADSGDKAERFRHMHRTAQVVAKMMQEIQDSAEAAVVEQGIDIAGDAATRKALHKAVRTEVRKMLPAIAQAVSSRILESQNASDTASGAAEKEEFDAKKLAEQFIPDENIDPEDVLAERDLPRIATVTVEAMLKDGFYWFDVDCSQPYYEETDADDGTVQPAFECAAGYTHIALADDGEHLSEVNYRYNNDAGVWESHRESDEGEERDHVFHLVDGSWQVPDHNADATVEFTANGGAIVEHGDGAMVINAVQRSLAGQSIARHLYELDAPKRLLASNETLFPAESSEYLFKIKRKESQYALFNWTDDSGYCEEYNGNCNIVNQIGEDGHQAVTSLDSLFDREGVVVAGLVHDESDTPLNVEMHPVEGESEWGKAHWTADFNRFPEYPQDFRPTAECEQFVPVDPDKPIDADRFVDKDGIDLDSIDPDLIDLDLIDKDSIDPDLVDLDLIDQNRADGTTDEIFDRAQEFLNEQSVDSLRLMQDEAMDAVPTALEGNLCVHPDGLQNDEIGTGTVESRDSNADAYDKEGYSRWRHVEVDGVKMVELTLPYALRHRIDFDDDGSIMLIEHDGFVRRGAHFSNRSVDSHVGYNPAAFQALLSEVETLVVNYKSVPR
ncbi:hypothetical protein AB833_24290 [Chromatiales bacterium (ex Bugula neritina AB1)]|nr:hypothetical protein AB833_24290 [Chromatiales bacterium (ex Bugula neritina AB1)]